ncbi:MAG: hypothetical protein WC468_01375 [Candidatus Paceibacterota bacterium]
MTENKAGIDEQQEKIAFFKAEAKKRRAEEVTALIIGWLIIGPILIFDFYFADLFWWGILIKVLTPIAFFLVMYFIWGPKNVGWGSFVREGYFRAIVLGKKRLRYIGGAKGKEFDAHWNVCRAEDVEVKRYPLWIFGHLTWSPYKDLVILGLHIIPEWPFGRIYEEPTEWERYYPTLKRAIPRKELINEFTLLPYPHYIDIIGAEDKNRLSLDILTNDVLETTNLDKALFGEGVPVIDIVKPMMRGGYLSFLKGTSLQDLLSQGEDIGVSLMENMLAPAKYKEYPGEKLLGMIERLYGVRTVSISIIDIVGADKALQDAINAQAVAKLKRDAMLVLADAKSKAGTIEIMGMAKDMFIKVLGLNDIDVESIEMSQLIEEHKSLFDSCLDASLRNMAAERKLYFDARTDGKGDSTLLSTMAVANAIGQQIGGKASTTGEPHSSKSDKSAPAKDGDKKSTQEFLREVGLDDDEEQ